MWPPARVIRVRSPSPAPVWGPSPVPLPIWTSSPVPLPVRTGSPGPLPIWTGSPIPLPVWTGSPISAPVRPGCERVVVGFAWDAISLGFRVISGRSRFFYVFLEKWNVRGWSTCRFLLTFVISSDLTGETVIRNKITLRVIMAIVFKPFLNVKRLTSACIKLCS